MHIEWKPRRDDITRRAQRGHGGSTTLTLTTPWRWWEGRRRSGDDGHGGVATHALAEERRVGNAKICRIT